VNEFKTKQFYLNIETKILFVCVYENPTILCSVNFTLLNTKSDILEPIILNKPNSSDFKEELIK